MKKAIMVCFFAFMTIACNEDMRKAVAPTKLPSTAVEVNLEVIELAKQGKPIDALKKGEEFLRSGSDPDGILHSTLARIYADVGDTESSVRHLQRASGASGNASMTVIVSREESASPQPAPVTPPAVSAGVGAATGGASAVIGPNGIEVRAGGASASVRN